MTQVDLDAVIKELSATEISYRGNHNLDRAFVHAQVCLALCAALWERREEITNPHTFVNVSDLDIKEHLKEWEKHNAECKQETTP